MSIDTDLLASIDTGPIRRGPQSSLERKLMLWTLLLVITPTLICITILSRITHRAVTSHQSRNVQLLGKTVASSLATDEGETLMEVARERLHVLNLDQRTAFVGIMDSDHRLIYRRAMDVDAWTEYRMWLEESDNRANVKIGKPTVLGDRGELIVHKVPIFSPKKLQPATFEEVSTVEDETAAAAPKPITQGYVLIGMKEPTLPATLDEIYMTQVTAACVICLVCLPLVIWSVRRVTNPLKGIVQASLDLATGRTPKPIVTNRSDEVGMLTEAFNFMAGRLVKARSLLESANQELEKKVQERTHELQRLNEQLEITAKQFESMAATDPLTGLHNRRAFGDALSRSMSEALRYDEQLACVMIDLDGFKQLNDTLGHQKGDELLEVAARALQLNCRGSDVAGRFGGDEFVLLLPRADELTARRVAERVQDCFTSEMMNRLEGTELQGKVTMSIGMATLEETGVTDPEQLLAKADHALYRAKEMGKNRLEVYRRARRADEDELVSELPDADSQAMTN